MHNNDNAGMLTVGLVIVVFLGYIFMSSDNKQKEISDMFFYYQNKDQYIDQCGEFFIQQKEYTDKDDRVNEMCQEFAKVLNNINKELYLGTSYEEKPNCTSDLRGSECE